MNLFDNDLGSSCKNDLVVFEVSTAGIVHPVQQGREKHLICPFCQ